MTGLLGGPSYRVRRAGGAGKKSAAARGRISFMTNTGIAGIRERMEREFAAVRAELRKIENAVEASRRDLKGSTDAHARLRHARELLREIEWRGADPAAGRRAPRHCPACKAAEPRHADGCELAEVLEDGAE
jgi:hypothetical protein